MAYHLGIQKNKKIWVLVIILVALGISAFLLANQCGFFVCEVAGSAVDFMF